MKTFKEYRSIDEAVSEKKFLNSIVDVADEINIDYNKKSTKQILGDILTALRKEKKYSKLYDFWSANRSKELEGKISNLFESQEKVISKKLIEEVIQYLKTKGKLDNPSWFRSFASKKYNKKYFDGLMIDDYKMSEIKMLTTEYYQSGNDSYRKIFNTMIEIPHMYSRENAKIPLTGELYVIGKTVLFSYNGEGYPIKKFKITDKALTAKIISEFQGEQSMNEKTGDKEEYQKFFDGMLKKYGVKSPDELSDEDSKKLFDEIDASWEGDNEVKEACNKKYKVDEAFFYRLPEKIIKNEFSMLEQNVTDLHRILKAGNDFKLGQWEIIKKLMSKIEKSIEKGEIN